MYRILPTLFLILCCFNARLCAQWAQVATGRQHTAAIKNDGTLWTWGRNNYGQLGTGNYTNSSTPVQVTASAGWVAVACGFDHTVALKSDGSLWAWGRNNYGQLGNGNTSSSNVAVQVSGAGGWATISAKAYATAAIRSNGSLWEWGSVPLSGGGTITISTPTQLGSAANWASVNMGYTHALALKTNGALWAWGENLDGELGNGGTSGSDQPVQIGSQTNWSKIAAGDAHSLALKTDGSMWAWGDNYYGQLGINSNVDAGTPTKVGTATNWTDISAGYDHSLAIDASGRLWTWGYDDSGMLGNGTQASVKIPTQVADQCKQSAGGQYHTMMISPAGDLCGAGNNSYGQLGDGSTVGLEQFSCGVAPPSCGNGLAAALPGLWKGMLEQQNNGSFYVEMNLQYNPATNTISGTSYIATANSSNYYAILSLSGAPAGNCSFTFTETAILEENAVPGTYWCMKTGTLTINENGVGFNIDGPWTAPNCNPGTIHLTKSIELPPALNMSAALIQAGQSITASGTQFAPSGQALLQISGPQAYLFETTLLVNTSGGFSYSFATTQNFKSGVYTVKATDLVRNKEVYKQVFVLANPNASNPIQITAPLAGAQIYQAAGNKLHVAWLDNYAPFPGLGQYHYKVEYRKTASGGWKTANADVNGPVISSLMSLSYELDLSGETINNSGETYQLRITDLQHNNRLATSPNFTVKGLVGSASVQLLWDYSYTPLAGNPVGVAADSVSRIYLKISGLSNVQKVSLSLLDGESDAVATNTKQLGKVALATQLNSYGTEANTANLTMITNNNPGAGSYVFWYVAPDDFARTSAGTSDFLKPERSVIAHFTIYYTNGATEVREQLIRISRPPLMFQHGINSDRFTFDAFKTGSGLLLKNADLFKVVFTNQLGAFDSFTDNAAILLSLEYGDQFSRSYRQLILAMRAKGFACNRLDYVGHSMGGCIARRSTEFLEYRVAENYGKGYINKLITLHTPHNGSPMADVIEKAASSGLINAAEWFVTSLQKLLIAGKVIASNEVYGTYYILNQFQTIDDNADKFVANTAGAFVRKNATTGRYEITAAARDLRAANNPDHISVNPGFRLKKSLVNNHLITGDIQCQSYDFTINWGAAFLPQYWQLMTNLFNLQVNWSSTVDLCPAEQALMDLVQNDSDFPQHSDFIVGTQSQTAGLPYLVSTPTTTVFPGVSHSGPFDQPATANQGEADKVLELLNSALSSGKFASSIPETPLQGFAPESDERSAPTYSSTWDTTKVKIRRPLAGTVVYVDSLLNIQTEIKQTAGLISAYLYFQGNLYFLNPGMAQQTVPVVIRPDLGLQNILFVARYQNGADVVGVYDSVLIQVATLASLQGFTAEPNVAYLQISEHLTPAYWAVYQGFIANVAPGDAGILVSGLNEAVVHYDEANHRFEATGKGSTAALIHYQGFVDSILFHVSSPDTSATAVPEQPIRQETVRATVFPNPSSGLFTVQVNIDAATPLQLDLTDCYGRIVYSKPYERQMPGTARYSLALNGLQTGVYFLTLKTEHTTITKRVVLTGS